MAQARVYGVDDRFWRFHGIATVSGPQNREALISPALAAQIDAHAGDSILVRVQRPTDIPLESLHGQRDNLGRSIRLTVSSIVPADSLDANDLTITLRVGNEQRQASRTSLMVVGVADAIAYLSRHTSLRAGDVIAMGTPEGVGPLVDGDVVRFGDREMRVTREG